LTAILILLALLSFGTIASRRGFGIELARAAGSPILIGIGFLLLSPRGLAFLDPEIAASLRPALRIGCAWLGLLLGLSTPRPSFARAALGDLGRASGAALWCLLVTAAATFGAIGLFAGGSAVWPESWARLTPAGVSLLVGALIQSSGAPRGSSRAAAGEVVGVIGVCIALAIWPPPAQSAPVYEQPLIALAAIVTLGAGLGLVQIMVTSGERRSEPKLIALLGLVTLLTGLAAITSLPSAAMGYFFGVTLALTGTGRVLFRRVALTSRPVRLVVLVLVGVHLGLEMLSILIGAIAAFARLLSKLTLLRRHTDGGATDVQQLVLGPRLAIPLVVSFTLSEQVSLDESGILSVVVAAIVFTDLLSAGLLTVTRAGAPEAAVE
jgi:hypothetical protein